MIRRRTVVCVHLRGIWLLKQRRVLPRPALSLSVARYLLGLIVGCGDVDGRDVALEVFVRQLVVELGKGRGIFRLLQKGAHDLETLQFRLLTWFLCFRVFDARLGLEVVEVLEAEDGRAYIQQVVTVLVHDVLAVLGVNFVNQHRN